VHACIIVYAYICLYNEDNYMTRITIYNKYVNIYDEDKYANM